MPAWQAGKTWHGLAGTEYVQLCFPPCLLHETVMSNHVAQVDQLGVCAGYAAGIRSETRNMEAQHGWAGGGGQQ